MSILKWCLLGVKYSLCHTQIGLLWGFNSNFPTSISDPLTWESPPTPGINLAMENKTRQMIKIFISGLKGTIYKAQKAKKSG